MSAVMKITTKNGDVIELMDVENIPAPVMSMIMNGLVTTGIDVQTGPAMMPLAPSAPPAPMIEGEPIAEDDEDEPEDRRKPQQTMLPMVQVFNLDRIGAVYVGQRSLDFLTVFRCFPTTLLSTRDVVEMMYADRIAAEPNPMERKALIDRLVSSNSSQVTNLIDYGLIIRPGKAKAYRMTRLGRSGIELRSVRKPASYNKQNKALQSYLKGLKQGKYE